MKKFLSLLLVVAMLMSMPVAASAAEADIAGVVVTADKTEVVPGDTITYTVTLTNAAAIDGGVWNYEYFLHIPQGLTLVDSAVTDTSVFVGGTFSKEERVGTSFGRVGSGYVGGDLALATLTCTVDEGVEGELTVSTYDVILADGNGVDVVGATGSVTVFSNADSGEVTESAGVIVTADKTEVVPGDTITYTVILTNAAAIDGGVWNYEYYLDIPAGLTLVEGTVVDTSVFANNVFLKNLKKGTSMGRFGSGYMGGDLVLATFTCTVDEGAEGELTLSTYNVVISTQDGVSLDGTTGSATVTATAGHVCAPETVAEIPATCTSDGVRAHSKCACGKLYMGGVEVTEADLIIPAMGHTEEIIPGKEATCTATGLTEGKKCSACGEILVAQTKIPVKGHEDNNGDNICDNGDHVMTGVHGDYYYKDGRIEPGAGLVWYNGAFYFVDKSGKILKDTTKWVSAVEEYDLVGGNYQFDSEGKMENFTAVVNGYYYTAGQIGTGAGLVKVGSHFYYVGSAGKVLKNTKKWISANNAFGFIADNYQFGANGRMEAFTAVIGGYYYCNGEITKNAGLVKVGTNFYYVDSTGKVLKNGTKWVSAGNQYGLPAANYQLSSNGKMIFTAVIGDYYYEEGEIAKGAGLVKVGKDFYYVDSIGKIIKDCTKWVSANEEYDFVAGNYEFGSDGKMVMFTGVRGDYYYRKGAIFKGAGLIEFEDNFYYVDQSGKILKNTTKWISARLDLSAGRYLFGEDGKMVRGSGLIVVGGVYYYLKSNSTVYIGKKWISTNDYGLPKGNYVFGSDGRMENPPVMP